MYKIASINQGSYEVKFSSIGCQEVAKYIQLSSNTTINLSLEESFIELESVTVSPGIYNIAAKEPTMSTLSLDIPQSPFVCNEGLVVSRF